MVSAVSVRLEEEETVHSQLGPHTLFHLVNLLPWQPLAYQPLWGRTTSWDALDVNGHFPQAPGAGRPPWPPPSYPPHFHFRINWGLLQDKDLAEFSFKAPVPNTVLGICCYSVAKSARRSNQSILKEINPESSLEAQMPKLKLQYFGHLMQRTNSLEKTLMLGKIEAGGEGDDRRWDGWMASLTQWTWVWANSGRQWRTGKPGGLQSTGPWRVSHTVWLNWTELLSRAQLVATPWPAARQVSLSFTVSRSLLKLMSIKSAMLSNHLIPA